MSPFLSNELPVPTKDGVRCDERGNFGKGAAADGLAADSKTATLTISQTEPSLTELLLEDSILLPEVVDDRVLLARDPSGHGGYENLPWMEHCRHPLIVATSKTDRQLPT